MKTVKTRKQGNAITVTVPKSLNIEAGKEYVVVKGENGSFVYVPKVEDIFEKAETEGIDLRTENEWGDDLSPVGRELI